MVDKCIVGVLLTFFALFPFVLSCFTFHLLSVLYLYSLGLVMLRMYEKTLEKERGRVCELDLDT